MAGGNGRWNTCAKAKKRNSNGDLSVLVAPECCTLVLPFRSLSESNRSAIFVLTPTVSPVEQTRLIVAATRTAKGNVCNGEGLACVQFVVER